MHDVMERSAIERLTGATPPSGTISPADQTTAPTAPQKPQ